MRRPILTLTAIATLASCGPFPADLEGTSERIESTRTIRVGLSELEDGDRALAAQFLARLTKATGAKPQVFSAPAERQLAALEAGQFDLVIGEFADDTPWLDDVAVIEPIRRHASGERTVGLAPVAANGENRWIGLLERTVRDMGPQS